MAKLVFPSANTPYRGFIGEVRGWFNRIATQAEQSPGSKEFIASHVAALVEQTGLTVDLPSLPSTSAIVNTGDTFVVQSANGNTGNFAVTLTIVDNVPTAVVGATAP